MVNIFFVMHKGLKKMKLDTGLKAAVSFGVSALFAIIFQFVGVKWLKARIIKMEKHREENEAIAQAEKKATALETGDISPFILNKSHSDDNFEANEKESATKFGVSISTEKTSSDPSVENDAADDPPPLSNEAKFSRFLKKVADSTINRDLETEAREMDDEAADIWDNAEVYDAKSEVLYSYLQVFTACALSFAHGSNDVANAIAPICAILAIYDTGALTSEAPVPQWVLVMGAFGIVIGLALFG